MKLIPFILAAALAAFISWGVYEFTAVQEVQIPLAVTAFITIAVTMGMALGVRLKEYPRSTQVIRSVSIFTCTLLIIVNALFAFFASSMTPVVLTDGILLILYLIAVYGVARSKQ